MEGLMTIKETGTTLRVSRGTIANLVRAGTLSSVCIGRRRLIRASSVKALIESPSA